MKRRPVCIRTSLVSGLLAGATATWAATESAAADASTAPAWEVAERGQDFAVYRRVATVPQADGSLARRVLGRFTLLENGLHYRDPATGAWLPSRDLIESFPDGAIARYGPLRAIFSHDLNAESVFDLETPAGARLRGGVRALAWLDEVTGERQLLGVVRASAPLELVPPNRLVAREAFEGVLADVVLEWRHDRFSQSVVLRELPEPPAGFEARATRLVVVTEFVEAPEPAVQRVAGAGEGLAGAEDHVGIHFDGASILVGHAFVAGGDESALHVGTGGAKGEAVSVRKSWTALPGGGAVLEESVGWEALAALGAGLPRQAGASGADERTWRTARAERGSERRPVAVAQAPYRPAGLMVDFELVPGSASGFTFQMGQTYYVRSNFYVGPGTLTFQPGCTIKFRHNAWLLAHGPVSFPDTLQTPVFTSKDDNSFGEVIKFSPDGPNYDPNDPDSDGDPSDQKAAQALWIYYLNTSTVVQNARFRWAQTAVRYDANPGVNVTHYLLNSLLEHCQTGVRNDMPDGMVSLSGVEMHAVTGPVSGPYQGSYTAPLFYTQKSFAGLNGNDGNIVPDTMGAIGPEHFLTTTTKGKIAVFDRNTGERLGEAQLLSSFLGLLEAADPRVWYDHGSQRWIVSAMDSAAGKVVIKVSLSRSAHLDTNNWRRYEKTFALGLNEGPDFPTLGVDANGIYLSTQIRGLGEARAGYRIWALKKPDVYTNQNYQPPAPLVVTAEELDTWCIQPAYNFDAPPLGGYAWLVAKGPASGNLGGQIFCRRLRWNGDNPEWVGNWQAVSGAYRDYYDIPQKAGTTDPILLAPHKDGTALELGHLGSRLMTAVIRNGSLWTCHHVGLDSVGGNYDGNPGWAVTRSAVQWFKLQVGTDGLTYSAHGRIYDAAWSNPYWYHFPSLNVNAAGDLLVGFSGSRATEYIGAFYRGRRANGTWMSRPVLVQAGRCPFAPLDHDRWGDYSATSVDPADGSFWTIQQYADPAPDEGEGYKEWGTWITQLRVAQ